MIIMYLKLDEGYDVARDGLRTGTEMKEDAATKREGVVGVNDHGRLEKSFQNDLEN